MVSALIKKRFPHSRDGTAVEWMEAGAEREVRADLAEGLVREGFIELRAKPAAPANAALFAAPEKAAGSSGRQGRRGRNRGEGQEGQ